jgi:predicted MFS family arabinose efflux permease
MTSPRFTSVQIRVLALLTLVNFVNYVDRQIIYPMFSLLRAEFGLTDLQVGFIGTVFSLVHSPATILLGYLADRTSRRLVITYGILFWSGATFLTGLANSYRMLLVSRALVGVGEGAYTPAATAIISGTFAKSIRARVQGVFDLGMFLGGAAGIGLGGIIAQSWGWRPAFFIVGVPGLILAFLVRRLPEPRPQTEPGEKKRVVPLALLLRVPAYRMVLISTWFLTFAGACYISWGTEFVFRYKGFSLRDAALILGLVTVLGGIGGVAAGATLADRLSRRFAYGRVLTMILGFAIASPMVLVALHTESRALFAALFFTGVFFMSWYHGPLTATIHDLTPEAAHASAIGVYYFFVNFFAVTIAPVAVGGVAGRYSLLAGMHLPLIAQVIGALLLFGVIYCIRRDGLRHPALDGYWEPAAPEAPAR